MNCCGNCTNATGKASTGGASPHRAAMYRMGFIGCKLERSEAVTRSMTHPIECKNWTQASPQQMEKRK